MRLTTTSSHLRSDINPALPFVRDVYGLSAANRVVDPCLPVSYLENITLPINPDQFRVGNEDDASQSELRERLKSDTNTVYARGTGEWEKCYESLKPFASQRESFSKCASSSCPDAGIKVPSIQFESSEFFAFSEFWYSMEDVLRMGGPYMANKFHEAAQVSNNLRFSRKVALPQYKTV